MQRAGRTAFGERDFVKTEIELKATRFIHQRPVRYALSSATLVALSLTLAGCPAGGGAGGGGMASSTGNNTSATLATVDGTNISRADLQAYTEAMGGDTALVQLVDYELLMKELKAKGLDVSDAEIEAGIAKQRQTLDPQNAASIDRMMTLKGPQAEAFRRQVKRGLAVSKLLTKDIKVTDAELKAWFGKNKGKRYPTRVKFGILVSSQKARADVMARQLSSNAKTFKNLVDEQKKLNDAAAQTSLVETPAAMNIEDLNPGLKAAIQKTKAGAVSTVVNLNAGTTGRGAVYGLVRVLEKTEPAFDAMRTEIETDYKLEQLARNELKSADPKTSFDNAVQQIRQALAQQAMQTAMQTRQQPPMPTEADAVAYLTRGAEQKLMSTLRESGKVEIKDPFYAPLANTFKKPEASIAPMGGASAPGAPVPGAPGGAGAPAGGAPSGAPAGAPPTKP